MGIKKLKVSKHTAPELAGYFEINGTDAQEYSTWRTHRYFYLEEEI